MPPAISAYTDRSWRSADGLSLHYREYPGSGGDAARPVVLCLPGLTRNARDFADLAEHLASPVGGGWRVLCAEMRGRGSSAWAADPATYTPAQYVGDVLALIEHAGLARFVAVGTSLGGLMTMALAMICPERLVGAVLNDIGPVLEAAGLAKISGYVGRDPVFAGWDAAAAALATTFAPAFPRWGPADWLAMARRGMDERADGTIRFAYDPRIAEQLAARAATGAGAGAGVPDLWPGFAAVGQVPTLLLRGALSDLLSAETFAAMQARLPDAETVTIADVGHAPTLAEPEALAAIDRLLARVK